MVSFLLAFFVAVGPHQASANAGDLDPTFGKDGSATLSVGSWSVANAAALDAQGRVVAAGQAELNGKTSMVITRLGPDGTPDPSFAGGSPLTVEIGSSAAANTVALQPDGKIVVAGTGVFDDRMSFSVVRLNANGTRDIRFGSKGVTSFLIGTSAMVMSVVVQPNGKLVLGGTATVQGTKTFAAARLNANGSRDNTFGKGGVATPTGLSGAANGVVLEPDGGIVLAGEGRDAAGVRTFLASRLRANGTLDTAFGTNGNFNEPIGAAAVANGIVRQDDGKLVLAGNAFTNTYVAAAIRLNAAGTKDTTFGIGGLSTVPGAQTVNGLTLQPDGRMLLPATGSTTLRLQPDGVLDASFGAGGIAGLSSGAVAANAARVQSDGRIVVVGADRTDGSPKLWAARLIG